MRNSSVRGQVTGDRSKNDVKSRLTMKIVQAVEKSFMYQTLEQSKAVNISDSIQKIAINETTPIFLQEMVSEQTSSPTNVIVLEIFWKP